MMLVIPCRARSRAVSVQVYQLQIAGTRTECCDGYAVSPGDDSCTREELGIRLKIHGSAAV